MPVSDIECNFYFSFREGIVISQDNNEFSLTADKRLSERRSPKKTRQIDVNETVHERVRGVGSVLWFLFILSLTIIGSGYWYVTELTKDVVFTRDQIDEIRLRLTQVTEDISLYDASNTDNDSKLKKELNVINSEIRKLWDVSNKRNRQWIDENATALEKNSNQLSNITKKIDESKKEVDRLNLKIKNVDQIITAISSEQLVVTSSIDEIKKQVDKLRQAVNPKQITTVSKAQEELTKQVNAMRTQLNLRLTQVENSIRELTNPDESGLGL